MAFAALLGTSNLSLLGDTLLANGLTFMVIPVADVKV
jgi:hypothetical protein